MNSQSFKWHLFLKMLRKCNYREGLVKSKTIMITASLETREIVHRIQVTLPQKCSFFVFHFYFIQHKTRFHILIISLYRLSNHKSSPEQYSPIFLADNSSHHDFLSFFSRTASWNYCPVHTSWLSFSQHWAS